MCFSPLIVVLIFSHDSEVKAKEDYIQDVRQRNYANDHDGRDRLIVLKTKMQ